MKILELNKNINDRNTRAKIKNLKKHELSCGKVNVEVLFFVFLKSPESLIDSEILPRSDCLHSLVFGAEKINCVNSIVTRDLALISSLVAALNVFLSSDPDVVNSLDSS